MLRWQLSHSAEIASKLEGHNWVRVFEMWRDKDFLELNSAKIPREHR